MEFDKVKELCKDIIKFYEKEQDKEDIPKEIQEKMSNLRLQKILFFLYGFYWKEKKEEILPIEFEAWHYGPVINELYCLIVNELDHSGKNRYDAVELNFFKKTKKTKYDQQVFKKILNYLGQFSTIKLVSASHDTEPWLKTPNLHNIDKNLIQEWFEQNVPEIR